LCRSFKRAIRRSRAARTPSIAEFVADRTVDVEKLFTHRWKLEQAEEAYKLFDTQTTGKAVILPP
jgi:L-iditol 2-dehydrogenase